ncbi:MAG: RNA 3'-terminal phosphate cyclase [Pirellulaceae bacterium]
MNSQNDLIEIDGSEGEGGGQIVRSSLALSLVTQTPVRLFNIRARRNNPGLLNQHLTAVNAATRIGNACVHGNELHSKELTFEPNEVNGGHYQFQIGTAGSTTLVLQTVLPALISAHAPSTVTIEGGTHNPLAPPFEFLEKAFVPLVNRLGPHVEINLEQHGFYPAGGGRIVAKVSPAPIQGFDILDRGDLVSKHVTILTSKLPPHVANREANVLKSKLELRNEDLEIREVKSFSPGNAVVLEYCFEHLTSVVTALGQIGVRAERLASSAARDIRRYMRQSGALDEFLTDQWLLPISLAASKTGMPYQFSCVPLSSHSTTQMDIIQRFLHIKFETVVCDDASIVVGVLPMIAQ